MISQYIGLLGRLGLVGLLVLSVGFEWEGRLGRLRRDMESTDPARRREVVRLLGTYPAADVRDVLLAALGDPDGGVRAEAADAVGRVRLREATPVLLDWLDDTDADVRASAARALGSIGDARSVAPLVRALGDAHKEVRRVAVEALAAIGSDEVTVPLLGRLDDTDPEVRAQAATALGRLADPRAVVPLVGRARDDVPQVRIAVYEALGDLGDERAVPALLQGTSEPVTEPRLAAVSALGRIGSDASVDALRALLNGSDTRLAQAAVAALGAIASPRSLAGIIEALTHQPTRDSAQEVLVSLGRRGSAARGGLPVDRMVAELTSALERASTRQDVAAIARVIERLSLLEPTREAAPALLMALQSNRAAAEVLMRALAATGAPSALVPLLEHLASESSVEQRAALAALGIYFDQAQPDGRAADPLLAVLGRAPADLRVEIVQLLGRIGAPRALPSLRPLLSHPNAELRLATVHAIGAIGDPEGAPALLPLLDEADAQIRFEAAQALSASATGETVTELLSRVVGQEPNDRHAALIALGGALPRLERGGSLSEDLVRRARSALEAVIQGADQRLAARAIDAAARWAHPSLLPSLIELGESGPNPLAPQATLALGAFDDDRARAALRARLGEGAVSRRTSAAGALGEQGEAGDAARLLDLVKTAPWPVPAAAAFSLARLARRGLVSGDLTPNLCELAASRDPYVRANAALGLAAARVTSCPGDQPDPASWLSPSHTAPVRVAAARWLGVRATEEERGPAQAALARCAERELAQEVAAACRHPELPPLDSVADVYAYRADGETLLVGRLVALRLHDGTALVAHTDQNGHLRVQNAPDGPLLLDDPLSTPLEAAQALGSSSSHAP